MTPEPETVLYIGRELSEDDPPHIREGIARRRIIAGAGRCPCGATAALPNRAERRAAARRGEIVWITVAHEPGCPAPLDHNPPTRGDLS